MDKFELRRSLLSRRQALSPQQWQAQSQKICDQLQSYPQFQQAKTILSYFSHRQEPDLGSLFTSHPQKCWGLPRCQGQELTWHNWQPGVAGTTNRYGILEPADHLPVIPVEEVDLILVPCVGCDRRGYRLGYGGGYYDRLLSQTSWQNKSTLGITFAFAYLEELPINPWDVKLQGICTEEKINFCVI